MKERFKMSCPNCCQLYNIKSLSSEAESNIPLFLKCGHSICEKCVQSMVKVGEPICCKICHHEMVIKTSETVKLLQNKNELYKMFPVNVNMLGELTLGNIVDKFETKQEPDNCFIDIHAIINNCGQTQGICLECNEKTLKMCQQCDTIICEECFTKSHNSFVVFKTHVLKNIESQILTNNCKIHQEKLLEYFCKDCSKSICMDCLMIGGKKSCKSHDFMNIQEMNKYFLEELHMLSPKVDDVFKRLTKTAWDIGHILHNMENDTSSEVQHVTASIEQHFSKLHAIIQKHKDEVLNIISKLKHIEMDSLQKIKNDVANAIKESSNVMKSLKIVFDSNETEVNNLSMLLDDAKKVIETPWYLCLDKSNKNTLNVTVNEDLCMLISDYIQLEGNARTLYKLLPTDQLEGIDIPAPPRAPVFPPVLQSDVRESKKEQTTELPKPSTSNDVLEEVSDTGIKDIDQSNDHSSPSNSHISPKWKEKSVQQTFELNEDLKFENLFKNGTQSLVTISHIDDPYNFYIRRDSDVAKLNSLEEELKDCISKLNEMEINKGMWCAVFNDSTWQRGFVVDFDCNADNCVYEVFCPDYGHTVFVNIDALRILSAKFLIGTKESLYPRPLATKCSLTNCNPKYEFWTSKDTDFMRKIINNKKVVIYIRNTCTVDTATTLECDVTTQDGVSIAHALEFHDLAVMPNRDLPYPTLNIKTEKPKYMSNNNLKAKSSEDVFITHVVNPGKFFVRECYLEEDYLKLCKDLDKEYELTDTSGSIYLPKVGMYCVVYIVKHHNVPRSGWCRGIIKSVCDPLSSGLLRVFLPDIGCTVDVNWEKLRQIKPKFASPITMATECYLAGVSSHSKIWNEESIELLEKYMGLKITLEVDKKNKRKSVGAVLYVNKDHMLTVNQEMVENNYAFTTDLHNLLRQDNKKELTPSFPNSQPSTCKKHEEIISVNTLPPKIFKTDDKINVTETERPLLIEAKILCCESPSLVYISFVHQEKIFNELYDDLQKFYIKRRIPRRENWKANDRCCAFCAQSQTWRRGNIIDVRKDEAIVSFTDFACQETVPISHIKKLHSDFEVLGNAAIKCHLAGISPALLDWPSLAIDFLKEKLTFYKRLFVTKVGDFQDKSMPIELWVYHTESGSALEPNTSEWRCLNKEIVEQGLGISDKSQAVNLSNGNNDSFLSFLNLPGSVSDWVQMDSYQKPSSSSDTTPKNSPDKCHSLNGNKTVFITDWLPAEPLKAKEFTGMPTYIDNNGVIYLHDTSQQDILDMIRDALKVGFKEDDPKSQFNTWRVDEPCIARYYLDNSFYRGQILEVYNEEQTCLVRYVDYGNDEICTFNDLRKSIALHQFPTQAHKCRLDRIVPNDGVWDKDVLDYIHKSIVEKLCFIKVTGEPKDGVTPIELKYDKLWINDHLVEFDMATYADGSKPIIRKFSPDKKVAEAVTVTEVRTDNEPDYLVEEENDTSEASGSPDLFKISTLVDDLISLEGSGLKGKFLSYPKHADKEFLCNITVINNVNNLELSIVRDAKTDTLYTDLFKTVQDEGDDMPPLDGIYENKACIAKFSEDNKWYRTSILECSKSLKLIKVRFVDYGNIELTSIDRVKEIKEDWTILPPATITANLYGVIVNPDLFINKEAVLECFADTFLDKGPFHAKIKEYENSLPCVELRNNDNELVYETLIQNEVLLTISI